MPRPWDTRASRGKGPCSKTLGREVPWSLAVKTLPCAYAMLPRGIMGINDNGGMTNDEIPGCAMTNDEIPNDEGMTKHE